MAITTALFVSDGGNVSIGSTSYAGSIKTAGISEPTLTKEKETSLGGNVTTIQAYADADDPTLTLLIYDDWNLAAASGALLKVLRDAFVAGTELSDVVISPAGSTAGMNEHTWTAATVTNCPPFGELNSDSETSSTLTVTLTVSGHSSAAIT